MKYYSHLIFGFLLYSILLKFFPVLIKPGVYILYFLGVLLPDIDHPKSFISRETTSFIGKHVKHRGFTHSIEFALICMFVVYFVSGSIIYGLGLGLGVLAHILGDALTVTGVKMSYILGKPHIRGFVRTGHLSEYVMDGVFIFLILLIWSGKFFF